MLEYQIFFDYGPMILLGFWLTLKIVVCAIALGIPLGLFLALGRRSNFIIVSFFSTSFIELFRNTPFSMAQKKKEIWFLKQIKILSIFLVSKTVGFEK